MADTRYAWGAVAVISVVGILLAAPGAQSAAPYPQIPDFAPVRLLDASPTSLSSVKASHVGGHGVAGLSPAKLWQPLIASPRSSARVPLANLTSTHATKVTPAKSAKSHKSAKSQTTKRHTPHSRASKNSSAAHHRQNVRHRSASSRAHIVGSRAD